MIHTFQECIKFQLFSVYVNTMREIKRVLETIVAEDDETEVTETEVTEGTSPAAVAVPVVLVVIIVVIVIIFIVLRRRRYHRKTNRYSTTVHDTHTLHLYYSKYCPQTGLHTALCKYLYSVV